MEIFFYISRVLKTLVNNYSNEIKDIKMITYQ